MIDDEFGREVSSSDDSLESEDREDGEESSPCSSESSIIVSEEVGGLVARGGVAAFGVTSGPCWDPLL